MGLCQPTIRGTEGGHYRQVVSIQRCSTIGEVGGPIMVTVDRWSLYRGALL